MPHPIFGRLRESHDLGQPIGLSSICTAHPTVLSATLEVGASGSAPVLIEATCNQVNHEGGYTGQTPAEFRQMVNQLAINAGFPQDQLILGGDHLGPNPWRHLPVDTAMERAGAMVAAYARAGFEKLHLDCSMGCAGEPLEVDEELVAQRASALAEIAEANAPKPPVYVIGTEVPLPGGALEEVEELQVTKPDAARATVETHREAFAARGLEAAFDRVVGLVVQPGVEFGNQNVVAYQRETAQTLSASLADIPGLVFEAHSTDYQSVAALTALVEDGFGILKVGPWLTFALREALYGLDAIAAELSGERSTLRPAMEDIMCTDPANWQKYYPGSQREQAFMRHFSLSDRIRYYWAKPSAQSAVRDVLNRLGDRDLPLPLIGQFLGAAVGDVLQSRVAPRAHALLRFSVQRVLGNYSTACIGNSK